MKNYSFVKGFNLTFMAFLVSVLICFCIKIEIKINKWAKVQDN